MHTTPTYSGVSRKSTHVIGFERKSLAPLTITNDAHNNRIATTTLAAMTNNQKTGPVFRGLSDDPSFMLRCRNQGGAVNTITTQVPMKLKSTDAKFTHTVSLQSSVRLSMFTFEFPLSV
jgi:hypothetical protein